LPLKQANSHARDFVLTCASVLEEPCAIEGALTGARFGRIISDAKKK
jgi:hypothetical protein